MLTAVIIDDDEIQIRILINLLTKLPSFEIKISGTANNLEDGVKLINNIQPDIVFLDINMPDKNGLEIFHEFKFPSFKIIFCTSFMQYALEAIKKETAGYLLKPVDLIELQETLQKVTKELFQEQKQLQLADKINILNTPEMSGENIMFDVANGFIMFNTRNIQYCYANQSYSILVTYDNKEIVITKSLKDLQKILPENQFCRTHKSFLINIYYLRNFIHAKESYVVLKSGIKIPVSVRMTSVITNDITQKMIM